MVDGHSTDTTVSLAQSFRSKLPALRVITSPIRHVCTQRNQGAKRAQGEYFLFIDADTRLPIHFLQGVKYRLESDPADLATTWVKSDQDNNLEKYIATAINYALELVKKSRRLMFPEAMTIIRSVAFHLIGGFNESIHYGESIQMGQAILTHHKIFRLYRDPVYSFSLRRLRKYGALDLASRMVKTQFAAMTGVKLAPDKLEQLYPMQGGAFFDKPYRQKQKFIESVSTIFKNNPTPSVLKNKLSRLIET